MCVSFVECHLLIRITLFLLKRGAGDFVKRAINFVHADSARALLDLCQQTLETVGIASERSKSIPKWQVYKRQV